MADVVVLGSLNLDLVAEVAELPRPGETVTSTRFREARGGKGANQAVAACRLGAAAAIVGAVGDDAHGQQLLRGLAEEGLDVSKVRRIEGATGLAMILVSSDAENVITVVPGANYAVNELDVQAAVESLRPGGVLLCQLEIPLDTVTSAVKQAHGIDALVVLNAAPVVPLAESLLSQVDVLVVNQAEAEALTGHSVRNPQDANAAARHLLDTGARAVVVTLGADGAVVVSPTQSVAVSAFRVDAVDTVGAGDAFTGALAAELAGGADLVTAATVGAAAGALTAQRPGAQEAMPRRDEVQHLMTAQVLVDAETTNAS